jgi:hypothetical protein
MNTKFACGVLLFALITAAPIFSDADKVPTVTAAIPFDFFINGDLLPKGEYVITTTATGVLCFYSKKTGAAGQAFVMRVAEPVSRKEAKLVFVLIFNQYRFVSFHSTDGVWRNSTVYQKELPPGATRHDVPVTYFAGD